MHLLKLAALAAALTAGLPAAAATGTAANGLRVSGNQEAFEVFARSGLGGSDYFCAAGDFARTRLGAGATDRVTVVAALSPSATQPGQRSVTFRLSPPDPYAGKGLFLRVGRPGATLTVSHARFLCRGGVVHLQND